jgi:UDP-glucose 4-epimerase
LQTFLITGGAGFIGSHLVDRLVERGDSVVVLDDLSTGRLENIEHTLDSGLVEFVEGSTLDATLVDDCMRSVDACLHLASAVGVQLITRRPLDSLLTNVRGNDIVISAAAHHGKRLLFTSTSEVYGKNSAELNENSDRILGSPFKSRWAYATAKAFGEALAHAYFSERGADTVVARLFNTVGPRQSSAYGMVLPRLVQQALAGEPVTVYGDGTQTRCFLHVADATNAILGLIDSADATGNVYNVGSTNEISIIELARKVIERSESDSTITLVPYADAYEPGFEELGKRRPDTSALRKLIGWKAARTLDETIDSVIEYERGAIHARTAESVEAAVGSVG